jgi:hypothetical protein
MYSINPPAQTETFEFPSHTIATLATGTNYTPELHRAEVTTYFSLKMEGAYAIRAKEITRQGEGIGFQIKLQGIDELEQFITSLEKAAEVLRRQSGFLG